MSKYYVGDIGTEIILDCGMDLTGATGVVIHVRKPDGTVESWSAALYTIDGDQNYIKYTVVEGDLDQAGSYRVQAGLTLSGWTGRGETATFEVGAAFELP